MAIQNAFQVMNFFLLNYFIFIPLQLKIYRMENLPNPQNSIGQVEPLQMNFQKITIEAVIEKEMPSSKPKFFGFASNKQEVKQILLKSCSGKFEPKTVTAIMGPSGSGKTTLLNVLSGRLFSQNLTLKGIIKINGQPVKSIQDFKDSIGYVMQEDMLFPTATPRQVFRFVTQMRLPRLSEHEKVNLVERMLSSLGIRSCANSYIGNSLIRGVSGGQKKRTSIGMELLTSPSLIFLDQPTTGLDSVTALNLIQMLNRLAKSGRTIVTTIHQPSSQIFAQFDKITLLLQGNIIYDGKACESMKYFQSIRLPVGLNQNPIEHYLKLMSKQGIALEQYTHGRAISDEEMIKRFKQRVNYLTQSYKMKEISLQSTYDNKIIRQQDLTHASICKQIFFILKRTYTNQIRNPLGLKWKLVAAVFYGTLSIIMYQRQSKTMNGYLQNLAGLIFFIVLVTGLTSMFGTINIFNQQRQVIKRQKLSNAYRTISYFVARNLSYLHYQLIIPILILITCYYVVHLQTNSTTVILSLAGLWLGMWMSASIGFFLSVLFEDLQVILPIATGLVLLFMLLSGFMIPLYTMPKFFKIFEYFSIYKYMYAVLIYAQFQHRQDTFNVELDGKTFTYKGNILSYGQPFYFEQPYWLNLLLMGAIGLTIRIIALVIFHFKNRNKVLQLSIPNQVKKTSSFLDQAMLQDSGKFLIAPNQNRMTSQQNILYPQFQYQNGLMYNPNTL